MDKPNGTEKESCAFIELQCARLYDSEAYSTLEQAAAAIWTLIDDSTALLFAECENSHDDVVNHLKFMRGSYSSSLELTRRLHAFEATVLDRAKQFEKKLEGFQDQITSTALKYELSLLPDEVLADMFVITTRTLKEKVVLSQKESYAFNELQCARLHASEAYSTLEQAAETIWMLVEDSTAALFAECENSHDDVVYRLEYMWKSYTFSLNLLCRLHALAATVLDRATQFERKLEEFESQISCTALNYGLNLLPDEVLAEIFVLAATTLVEKVAFSLVCKRFRRVMMSMRRMWDGYRINSSLSPEQIIAIAEGNRFVSLKARLCPRSPLSSVEYILSLEPEELEITSFDKSSWESLKRILSDGNKRELRSLVIRDTRKVPSIRILNERNFPYLEHLEADFVPATPLGRNLVRCRLDGIRDNELDPLRIFLENANSLQDLHISIRGNRFYKSVDLPSLRGLEVNFIPHPSLAKYLVRFRLVQVHVRRVRLSELLDFLSASKALQELVLHVGYDDIVYWDTYGESRVVTMPSIVSCIISDRSTYSKVGLALLTTKLRMPILRTLKLELGDGAMVAREKFRTSLQSMTLLEELELRVGVVDAEILDEIIRFAPYHLESFSLNDCRRFKRFVGMHTSPAPLRQLIRFADGAFDEGFMTGIVDHLRSVGLDKVKVEFCNCERWKSGVFGLDEVFSAKLS